MQNISLLLLDLQRQQTTFGRRRLNEKVFRGNSCNFNYNFEYKANSYIGVGVNSVLILLSILALKRVLNWKR